MDTEKDLPVSDLSAASKASSTDLAVTDLSESRDSNMEGFSKNDWGYAFRRMASVFPPNTGFTNETSEVYAMTLENYSRQQIHAAIAKWLRTGARFPYPADLIGVIEGSRATA